MKHIDLPWLNRSLNWSELRTADDCRVNGEMVYALISAKITEDAKKAYQRLDGTICKNGVVYGAALPVVQLILAYLPSCTEPARIYCLDLLGEIMAGEADDLDKDVVGRCITETMRASWYFLHGLQYDNVSTIRLYTDLLCILGSHFEDFRPIVKFYLESALTRDISEDDVMLIRNTLAEIINESA